MTDFLYSVDLAIFHFINRTLSNPVGDYLWPFITDYDKQWPVRIVLVGIWLWLMIKGGNTGRTVGLMVIPVIVFSDKLSSEVIKPLINRPRPCHQIDGVQMVQDIHLLVGCGSGRSFPSSHATNNFAVATIFAFFYRRWKWWFYAWALLVAISRPAVGVHYPSDALGGAIVGTLLSLLVIWIWLTFQNRFFPQLSLRPQRPESRDPLS